MSFVVIRFCGYVFPLRRILAVSFLFNLETCVCKYLHTVDDTSSVISPLYLCTF
jgi:hypothetical protein